MALVYVCIGVLALSWMFFVGVKFEKAKQDEKEVNASKKADLIIRKAEKEFEEKYEKSLHKK